jgi:hypothetical protein
LSTVRVVFCVPTKEKALTIEFTPWPKTSRFFRDIVITEKIDGTNAAVGIVKMGAEDLDENSDPIDTNLVTMQEVEVDGEWGIYGLYAQSRNKLIFHGKQDNYGFAQWVHENRTELVQHLGEGLHFGEWWGSGIQRGYGLQKGEKHFSLFNTDRFQGIEEESEDLVRCVPVLYKGSMEEKWITHNLDMLQDFGSAAAPGFKNPEGICIYHTSSRLVQKVTLDNNDAGKWEHL